MRLTRTAIGATLVVSLGCSSYAWTLGRDAARTSGESTKSQEPSSTAQQDQSKPPKQPPPAKQLPPPRQTPPPKQTQKAEPPKTEEAEPPKAEKKSKEQSRQEQKQQKVQPAGNSARIPRDQFKAHFGQPHRFAAKQLITTTRIIPNQTRFVYFGYTFIFVDPWPTDWLLTDDCYIDYIDDQYFLFDVFHPGIRVALIIVG